jgi:hypothetical protein
MRVTLFFLFDFTSHVYKMGKGCYEKGDRENLFEGRKINLVHWLGDALGCLSVVMFIATLHARKILSSILLYFSHSSRCILRFKFQNGFVVF